MDNVKTKIFQILSSGSIGWKNHALQRLFERNIRRSEVFETLKIGEIIEEYTGDFPLQSFLIFNNDYENPLHVVFAIDESAKVIYIITVYRPDNKIFEKDLKTRKRK